MHRILQCIHNNNCKLISFKGKVNCSIQNFQFLIYYKMNYTLPCNGIHNFYTDMQERERKERFEEAVRQKELKKAEMAQK